MREAEVAYVRLASADVGAQARFAGEEIGLQAVAGSGEEAWFRSDIRRRTVVFHGPAAGPSAIGIAYRRPEDLDEVLAALETRGVAVERFGPEACARMFVRAGARTADPSGNVIDLVHAPHHAGKRFFPQRDNGIRGLEGVHLRSLSPERDLPFWRDLLGFDLRDRVGEIAFLGCDSLHHRIALFPAARPGLLAVNFAVEDLELVMQNRYHLAERQVRIAFGPGRQPASGQIFLQVQGPEGLLYGLVAETRSVDPARHRPRQFEAAASSLCGWGARAETVAEYRFDAGAGAAATAAPAGAIREMEGT